MHDILPADLPAWQKLERTVKNVFDRYGFSEIRYPIVEKTELFTRAMGETTDVVEKEMYTFEDRNGDLLSLRPEGTASVVRSVLQHGLLYAAPQRLWYGGPMFRRERPQKGRTRQFHQFGAEVFGSPGPDIDAELLAMCHRLWKDLGIKGLRLEINSLGTAAERESYRTALRSYFAQHSEQLDKDSIRRLDLNPLRILDSKNESMKQLISAAPSLQDYLAQASREHFEQVLSYLEKLGIEYEVNTRLVRGLDYYSHTVFEWVTDQLGAQGTVCAGGRYDGLVELQGGKPWPGIGFAMGQERLVELIKAGTEIETTSPHAYLVMVGDKTTSDGLRLAEALREEIPALRLQANLGGGSFKSQFKRADRSEAELALVLGEDELSQGVISIKHLRSREGQEQVALDNLTDWLNNWLASD
jgi:histidyl-tRNA synthetase